MNLKLGHENVTKLLIDHKADVNTEALERATPLHYAAKNGNLKLHFLTMFKHGRCERVLFI